MSCNPEDETIAAIEALIDEQLAAGWRDDYDADYYPYCDNCPHDWHGTRCQWFCFCGCEGSTGERVYVDQIESVRRGYTIRDIEAMRWHVNPYR